MLVFETFASKQSDDWKRIKHEEWEAEARRDHVETKQPEMAARRGRLRG